MIVDSIYRFCDANLYSVLLRSWRNLFLTLSFNFVCTIYYCTIYLKLQMRQLVVRLVKNSTHVIQYPCK